MSEIQILLIDDDKADRKLVRRMLTRMYTDIQIHEAQDEVEAMSCDIPTPHAVIVDHMLPGCTGLDLLPEINRKWPGSACIMMTGYGDEDIAKSAIKNGATDYISKRALNENALTRMIERGVDMMGMQSKLAEQRRELEVFADVLVHDLKAPIRAVDFLTTELEEDIADGNTHEVSTSLKLLKRSALQMRSLVDSLASHVRIDRDMEFETASLYEIVKDALLAQSRSIQESKARIDLRFVDVPILCCPPQLGQLVQNVIANAIKYRGPQTPVIEIAADRTNGNGLHLTFSDNGIGIAPDYLNRVFEPFKRAPSQSDVAGSGLGLATCRKVAQRHGGDIWCTSTVGKGTTMHLTLPNVIEVALPRSQRVQ